MAFPSKDGPNSYVWKLKDVYNARQGDNWPTYIPGTIGIYSGGLTTGGSNVNIQDEINYVNASNAVDFGDLASSFIENNSGCGSATRALIGGAISPGNPGTSYIDVSTYATRGSTVFFGEFAFGGGEKGAMMATSNGTRAIWYGMFNSYAAGPTAEADTFADKIIQYSTIASTGNTTDFGDLIKAKYGSNQGVSSPTRAVLFGGTFYGGSPQTSRPTNVMEYVTIASTGNSTDFGDLSTETEGGGAGGSSTRGVLALGATGATFPATQVNTNTLEYITIATTSNTTDFGDLTTARQFMQGNSNSTRAFFAGGRTPTYINVIDYVTIDTTGNASDWGDLTQPLGRGAHSSSSHGGL
jgi:hypothetical protein